MKSPRIAVSALAVLAGMLAPPPVSAAPTESAGDAVQQFGACMSARKSGDLLLLIDRSGSLATTDPQGVRATAASYLLDQLATTTAAAGTTLNVAVSGFDVGYENVVGWTRLDASALPGLRRSVDGFRNRHSGVDTDYVAALQGVLHELSDRGGNSQPGCRAVLWFTDGKFDLDERRTAGMRQRYGDEKPYAPGTKIDDAAGVKRAVDAGRVALCRPGGIADQVRASGILTIAEGLGGAGSSGADFAFLRSVATGTDPNGGSCGNTPQSTVGEFRLAGDIDDLLFAFDAVGDPRQAPTRSDGSVCPRTTCPGGSRTFVLDPSIRSVHVLAGADVDGVQVTVQAPGGATAAIGNPAPAAPASLGGGAVTSRWLSTRTLDLAVRRDRTEGWSGPWSVTVVDPSGTHTSAKSRIQLRITGDLVPGLVGADRLDLHTGDTPAVQLALLSEATGKPVPPADLPGEATIAAELRSTGGNPVAVTPAPVAKDALSRPVTLDLKRVAPGSAVLRLTLREKTAGVPATADRAAVDGTQLADRVVDVPLTVLPPLNFPRVSPHLTFHGGEGTGPFPANLTVTGPGCVWVDGATITAGPDGAGASVAATSADSARSCVTVAAGRTANLPVQLTLRHPGTGTVAGNLSVRLAPAGEPQRALPASVPFLAEVVKPPAQAVRTSVLIAALLLGLGLPTLFLYLAKWWTARIPGRPLLAGAVSATVTDAVVLRDGRPFTVDHDDVSFLPVDSGGTRRLEVPGTGLTLRTKTGWRPTAPGYTAVVAPGRIAVVERLPLAVHNTWVATLDDPGADRVQVQVLVPGSATAATYARLSEQIRSDLPRLAAAARRRTADTPNGSGGGAGTGGVAPTTAQSDWFGGGPTTGASAPRGAAPAPAAGDDWWAGT